MNFNKDEWHEGDLFVKFLFYRWITWIRQRYGYNAKLYKMPLIELLIQLNDDLKRWRDYELYYQISKEYIPYLRRRKIKIEGILNLENGAWYMWGYLGKRSSKKSKVGWRVLLIPKS